MPFITFTVTGLDKVMSDINKLLSSDLPNTRRNVLSEVSNFMVGELKRNAHVITGNMRNSVRSQPVTDMQYLVEVGAPYAFYENKRPGSRRGGGGPHNFADMAEQATNSMFSNVVSSAYGNMFSSL